MPNRVRWSTPVDLAPPAGPGGDLYIHYGSPVITRVNTILVPQKTTAAGDFKIDAHRASDGMVIWSVNSDYTLPAHNWVPVCGITLTPKDRYVAFPGAGGTVLERGFPDSLGQSVQRLAFYGITNYNAGPTAFASAIQINTPITCDNLGNLYFGFISNGAALPGYPSGILSGLARISSAGAGVFVSAPAMSGNAAMQKVAMNCAPALSNDGKTVYVAVNGNGGGYLCALDSTSLARKTSVGLLDPRGAFAAGVPDDGSATPTVGPDGDVYYGVLEASFPSNQARGWLLHYDSTLAMTKIPNAFGWDDTASVVPASLVPQYMGTSTYLLLTKYNNYANAGIGGDGDNRLAIVDPNDSMMDPVTGATVMKTVITVAGVTPDEDFTNMYPNAVREWCINSAAIDVVLKCAVVNSEDGRLYRWDFASNSLLPFNPMGMPPRGLYLAPATGEAYTPTVIGPDGAVYAINDAILFSCVEN